MPGIASMSPQHSIAHYRITAKLGEGGMGAVYKARQKQLNRLVALKILPPGIGRDAAFAERFTREARALAQLNHPGIVRVYDYGYTDATDPDTPGAAFLVMEFIEGESLDRILARTGALEPRFAMRVAPTKRGPRS